MDFKIESSLNYSKELTAFYSKSFFMSTKLLPRKFRMAVYGLYGFCRYIDNLIDQPRSRSSVEILNEVEAFREELKIASRSGESEHPIISAYIHVAKEYGIPLVYPLELLTGVSMDVKHKRYKSFDELYQFCYRVAGVVGVMMTFILGYENDDAFEYAVKLGVAMQLTNILRDIKEDKDNSRIYLPLEELHEFNVSEHEILHEKFTPCLKKLMVFSAERAHQYYEEAKPGINMLKKDSRFAIIAASRIYRGILNEIEQRDYNPFLGRVYVSQSKKMRIILAEYIKLNVLFNHKK